MMRKDSTWQTGTQRLSPAARAVGYGSAVLATAFSIAYDLAQIAEWMGWLGSQGGAGSTSTPFGLVLLHTPSLFLGPTFLILMVSVHQLASPDRTIWSHLAIAFATAYAVLISLVYFVQLTWVVPRMLHGQMNGLEPFLFVPFNSFLYSVDILGYSFMSVATFFAARVFTGGGVARIARNFLTANGLLLPFLALQMYVHPLIWVAGLWAVTFPGATASLAVIFRQARATPGAER